MSEKYRVTILFGDTSVNGEALYDEYGDAFEAAWAIRKAGMDARVTTDTPTDVTSAGDPGTTPRFRHSACGGCLFVGRIGTRDAWYCEDSYTLMLRDSDDHSGYESMNLESYIDHLMRYSMNRWALVVAKAYACGYISDQRILGRTEVK